MDKVSLVLHRVEQNRFLFLLTCILFAVVSLLLFSQFTSPLNPYHGGDQSIFLVIGRGITEGLLPYKDLYDHKGVVLFFIDAIGWWICPGKAGVYAVQCLFFAADIALVWKICRLFAPPLASVLSTLFFCAVFIGTISGGNTCEEYALPLNLAPFYLYLRAVMQSRQEIRLPFWLAWVSGVCLALAFFIRMNDAALLLAIPPVFFLHLLRVRGYGLLIRQFAGWLGGFLAVVSVVGLVFCFLGAWDEFLEGTFLHNVRYALNGVSVRSAELKFAIVCRLAFVPVLGGAVFCMVRRRQLSSLAGWLVFFCCFSASVSRWLGEGYIHYFTATSPFLAVTAVLVHVAFRRMWVTVLVAIGLFAPYAMSCAVAVAAHCRYNFTDKDRPRLENARKLAALIPEEERGGFWAFDTPPDIYTLSGLMPCCPFFTMQVQHSKCVPRVEDSIRSMLAEGRPLWLVVGKGCRVTLFDCLTEALNDDYELVDTLDNLHVDVYRRKGSK